MTDCGHWHFCAAITDLKPQGHISELFSKTKQKKKGNERKKKAPVPIVHCSTLVNLKMDATHWCCTFGLFRCTFYQLPRQTWGTFTQPLSSTGVIYLHLHFQHHLCRSRWPPTHCEDSGTVNMTHLYLNEVYWRYSSLIIERSDTLCHRVSVGARAYRLQILHRFWNQISTKHTQSQKSHLLDNDQGNGNNQLKKLRINVIVHQKRFQHLFLWLCRQSQILPSAALWVACERDDQRFKGRAIFMPVERVIPVEISCICNQSDIHRVSVKCASLFHFCWRIHFGGYITEMHSYLISFQVEILWARFQTRCASARIRWYLQLH